MLTIERIEHEFTLLKVRSLGKIDIEGEDFLFVGKTDEELSLVCISDKAPEEYTIVPCEFF